MARGRVTFVRGPMLTIAAMMLAAGCTTGGTEDEPDVVGPTTFAPDTTADGEPDRGVERPAGGTARVGVWAEPDLGAPHLGGAALRALVYPQLFVVGPDGEWRPSLVEPGSDRTSTDRMSASFRLREDAVWSDGTPITAADLRRSADRRFVAAVDIVRSDGGNRVRVRFTQPYPGWRRLWSFVDAVSPPRDGLWGGPFELASFTDGLEAVLRPNEQWWGSGPFLSEVRLVLVPNVVIAHELLERGELDAVMPLAVTVRTAQLEDMDGVEVDTRARSGWWTALHLSPDRLSRVEREGVVATVDRVGLVGTLLKEEATVLDGLVSPEDATWSGIGPGGPSLDRLPPASQPVDLVGTLEEPMRGLLQRSMQLRARPVDARLELRNAEVERVTLWLAAGDYDAAIAVEVDPPEPCWTCRFAGVDEALAREADAGDLEAAVALERRLRDDYVLLPLWRHKAVVAWRAALRGPAANGYALSAAWNAATWWYDDPNLRQ